MAITIDDLRRDWINQIAAYDQAIALLENERQNGVPNEFDRPARAWEGLLEKWRDELKQLLTQYPGTP